MRALVGLVVGLVLLAAAPLEAQRVSMDNGTNASLSSTTCPGTGCVTFDVNLNGSAAVQVTGSWTATLSFQGSIDGATFQTLNATPTNSSTSVTTTTSNGLWTMSVGGLRYVRVVATAYTSGTAVVSLQWAPSGGSSGGGGGGGASDVTIHDPTITTQKVAVNASGQMSITCANCSGSGASAVDNSVFVAGTTSGAPAMGFYHSTIDTVTDGDTAAVAIDSKRNQFMVLRDAATNARGANVTAGNALVVDGSASTQPISGTVTANAGSNLNTSALALEAGHLNTIAGAIKNEDTVAVNAEPLMIVGATHVDTLAILPNADGDHTNLLVDGQGSLYVTLSQSLGANTVRDDANLQDGQAFVPGTSRILMTGAEFDDVAPGVVVEGRGGAVRMSANRNLYGTLRDAAGNERGVNVTAGNALVVDGSAATQPVSGTVTAIQGTGTNLHAVIDSGTITTVGAVTAITNALPAGAALIGKVGIDQTTPGTTNAISLAQIGATTTATGNGVVGAGVQRVAIASDNTAFSVNANAGTNLNTSALVLEATVGRAQASATAGQTGPIVQGAVTTAAPSYTTAQTNPLSLDLGGSLRVNCMAGCSGSSFADNAAFTYSTTTISNAGLVVNEGTPNVVAENSAGVARMSANRIPYAQLFDGFSRQTIQPNGAANVYCTNCGGTTINVPTLGRTSIKFSLSGTLGQPVTSTGSALDVNVKNPVLDACQSGNVYSVAISQTANARLVIGTAGKRLFICHYVVVGADAENLSFVEGTGSTCATGVTAVIGGATAANGMNLAANGGVAAGAGLAWIAATNTLGNDLCLLQSGAGRVGGSLKYALQ